jgi:hypothetical protein
MENSQQPDQQYLQKLETVDFKPIFILGLHRSGTSILYKTLTATKCFNPVTAYHIVKYDRLIKNHIEQREETEKNELTESFKKEGLDDRKIDGMKLTADFEEEYGFLLSKFSQTMAIVPKNINLFQEMCKKIQFISENNKPILLKNPFDFTNFLYIKQALPAAKFVFIQRHPLKTISSNLHANRMIFENKNSYTAALSNIYEMFYSNPIILPVLRFMYTTVPEIGIYYLKRFNAKAIKYFLNNVEKLPNDDFITVTYEEFCQFPQKTVGKILEKFSLTMDNHLDASSAISPRKADIDVKVRKMRRSIYSSMKPFFEKFKYTMEED